MKGEMRGNFLKIIILVKIVVIIILVFPYRFFTAAEMDLPDLALQGVSKTQSQIFDGSQNTWKVLVKSGTPVENESIQIEVLEGISRNPTLKSSGHVDFSSLKAIVEDVVSPGMTDGEKALALWRFVMENCYLGEWGTSLDGLEHLNVYGYGYCGTFASVLEALWWAASLKARHVNTGNHAATEVFYDNDWHYIDANTRNFLLNKDNQTIASLEALNNDPGLWDRKRRKDSAQRGTKKYYYMTMHPNDHGRSPVYSNKFTMAKGDVLKLSWKKNGKWCLARGEEGGSQHAPEPPIYANGFFKFHRDLSKPDECQTGLISSKNVSWQDSSSGYLHPMRGGEEAYLIYQVKVPYFMPETTISGAFLRKNPKDFIGIDLSTDNGAHWTNLWSADKIGNIRAEVTTTQAQEITTDVPWKYSYLIRVRMRAEKSPLDVGGFLLESFAQLFYNPKSLPALKGGENVITFRDDSNSIRSLKITYNWKEDLPIRISKELPLEGEEVTLTARVFNQGKTQGQKVPVVFYLGDPKKGGMEIGRDFIGSISPGEMALAKVKWKATRRIPASDKTEPNPGAAIFVIVDPEKLIPESNKENNTSFRIIKVLNLPEVYIPSESFIRFDKKKDYPDVITINATVRNFSNYTDYGYYLNDHADATGVVVKFFDGDSKSGHQIGSDGVIDRLQPLDFKNVSVDWNISKLSGVHRIYVQVFPGRNVIQALGPRGPSEISTGIDLNIFRACASTRY
jgi:hypothetical protein